MWIAFNFIVTIAFLLLIAVIVAMFTEEKMPSQNPLASPSTSDQCQHREQQPLGPIFFLGFSPGQPILGIASWTAQIRCFGREAPLDV
jgi:hypothetical protein